MNVPGRMVSAAFLATLVTGCVAAPKVDYSRLLAASPRSILVVPVVNNTVDVDAANYFLSTISIPVAERGYYVFPVNLVKRLLEDDGLSDASMVHAADPGRLAALFGADAVLYIAIQRWEARYLLITTQVTVELTYTIKDGRTGETLWTDNRTTVYQPNSNSGGGGAGSLLAALVSAAVTKAAPNYIPLANLANAQAMGPYGGGFPIGPYRAEFGTDYPRSGQVPSPPAAR
jgi:hypothetical protein